MSLTVQDGKLVVRNGAIGTGAGCCCNATGPCVCSASLCGCVVSVTVDGNVLSRQSDQPPPGPYPECDDANSNWHRISLTEAPSGSGGSHILAWGWYEITCQTYPFPPFALWRIGVTVAVTFSDSSGCLQTGGPGTSYYFYWDKCGTNGCPTGAPVLDYTTNSSPGWPEVLADHPLLFAFPQVQVNCNPLP